MSPDVTAMKHVAREHVEIVREQLDDLTRMLASDANCVDVVKQIQTVQQSLERASDVTLHRHLETCFSNAILHGRGGLVIDELVDAVTFTPALTGPQAQSNRSGFGRTAASSTRRHYSATTLTLPGIASRMCKAAIERVVTPIAGVGAAEVDVLAKSVTIYHDYRATARRLIEAIEEQGYHVSGASASVGGESIGNPDPGFLDGDGI
jgi:DNA-binding FrmR family transcriptional regulator/copper chaperone CopZ